MLLKRFATIAATVLMVVSATAIPAFATSYYYFYESGPQTFNGSNIGKYMFQGEYAGWTTSQVRSSYPSHTGNYKEAHYWEYRVDSNNLKHLLYYDYNMGVSNPVYTYLGHDISINCNRRDHSSYLHETSYQSSSIIEGIETVVS